MKNSRLPTHRNHLVHRTGSRSSWGLMLFVVCVIATAGYFVVKNSHAASDANATPSPTVLANHVPSYSLASGTHITATELGLGGGILLAAIVLGVGLVTVWLSRRKKS